MGHGIMTIKELPGLEGGTNHNSPNFSLQPSPTMSGFYSKESCSVKEQCGDEAVPDPHIDVSVDAAKVLSLPEVLEFTLYSPKKEVVL